MSATSSNHSKILAIHEASRECLWLRSVTQHIRKLCGISLGQESLTVVHEDNSTCIALLKDEYIKGDKTKHILPKFLFTHYLHKSGDIIVQKVRLSDNQANLFTKALPTTTSNTLVYDTGMRRLNELNFHPTIYTKGGRPDLFRRPNPKSDPTLTALDLTDASTHPLLCGVMLWLDPGHVFSTPADFLALMGGGHSGVGRRCCSNDSDGVKMKKRIKKSSGVLASNSRCISAEAVPKKKIRKRKGRSDASDTDAETKQEKEPRCR
ncbi:hypothetical protein Tco_0900810 [Tanacetum coccineum]